MKIGIFGDIHEDIESLRHILNHLEKEACDQWVCLGDIVGYDDQDYGSYKYHDPDQCVNLVKNHCQTVVAGNHDLFAIRKIPKFQAGYSYRPDWYSIPWEERNHLHAQTLWDYCLHEEQSLLDPTTKAYLESLPEYAILKTDAGNILFSHHLYPDVSGSTRKMPQWLPDVWSHFRWMRTHHCDIAVSGHTHLNGTLTASWIYLYHTGNQTIHLGYHRRWLTCPPVTRGPVPSGFLVLDTSSRTVSIHLTDSSNRK